MNLYLFKRDDVFIHRIDELRISFEPNTFSSSFEWLFGIVDGEIDMHDYSVIVSEGCQKDQTR